MKKLKTMYRIGILMFGDPTRDGCFPTELKWFEDYAKSDIKNKYEIICVNPVALKRLSNNPLLNFFSKRYIKLDKVQLLNDYNLIILSQPLAGNFFGGKINLNTLKAYRFVSYFTNELNRKVLIRINDSKLVVRDYKKMMHNRISENQVKFINLKHNQPFIPVLSETNYWNYDNVLWLGNGNPKLYDWIVETVHDSIMTKYVVFSRETIQKNSIYLSDDLFFRFTKNIKRCEDFNFKNEIKKQFCYIGFFDSVNRRRSNIFNNLFNSKSTVPIYIIGKKVDIIKKHPNLLLEEKKIPGDSYEYFNFLNSNLAYISISKGLNETKYIGKTIYDSIAANTPVVVYQKSDPNNLVFSNKEYYFNNEKELKEIYEKLLDNETRKKWVELQKKELYKKLYNNKLDLLNIIQ